MKTFLNILLASALGCLIVILIKIWMSIAGIGRFISDRYVLD